MIRIVWRFQVRPGREPEFERHYSANGAWAGLFRRYTGYLGTELLRDQEDPQSYLTIDNWADLESYNAFRAGAGEEYDEIDRQMGELTLQESKIGTFRVLV